MTRAALLMVGTRDGLKRFQSVDDGETWRHTSDLQTHRSIQMVSADPFDFTRAYGVSYSGLVFVTQDGGLTFNEMPPKIGCKLVHSIHPMKYKNAHLLLGVSPSRLITWIDGEWAPVSALTSFIHKMKWKSHMGNAKITSILDHPKDRKQLYIGIEVGGVVKSYDLGETWDEISDGINRDVHNMVFGERSNIIYGATENGVYLSDNEGEKWHYRSDGISLKYTTALVTDKNKRMLFVAGAKRPFGKRTKSSSANSFSLFRSENGADSWTDLSKSIGTKLKHGIGPKSLVIDDENPNSIYFSTYDGKVFQSFDAGETFRCISEDLPLTYSVALRHVNTLD